MCRAVTYYILFYLNWLLVHGLVYKMSAKHIIPKLKVINQQHKKGNEFCFSIVYSQHVAEVWFTDSSASLCNSVVTRNTFHCISWVIKLNTNSAVCARF